MVSFVLQKLLVSWGHIYGPLILEPEPLIICSGKLPLCQCVQDSFLLSLLLGSVYLVLFLRSLIHLDLSFVSGNKYESIFILHMDNQLDHHYVLASLSIIKCP